MANPYVAYASGHNIGGVSAQSTVTTAELDLRSTFGFAVDCQVFHLNTTGVSAPAEVWAVRSANGSGTYDSWATEKTLLHSFSSVGNTNISLRKSVFLDRGRWIIGIQRSGPASASAAILTAEVISAYA